MPLSFTPQLDARGQAGGGRGGKPLTQIPEKMSAPISHHVTGEGGLSSAPPKHALQTRYLQRSVLASLVLILW